MSADHSLLADLWVGMAVHLWQTTLVLLPLFLIGWLMRSAPARLLNLLWWTALAKLLLPLAIFGRLGERVLASLLAALGAKSSMAGGAWLEGITVVLDPTRAAATPAGQLVVSSSVLTLLTIVWVAGATAILLHGLWGYAAAARRAGASADSSAPVVHRRVRSAVRSLPIRPGRIRVTADSTTPSVVGLLRPRILLPERLVQALTTEDLRAILIHEQEHCRRWDLFRGLPLLWPLLRRLHSTAEIACDEAVVDAGVAPVTCARALARALSLGLLPAASPAALNPGRSSLIRQRFDRLTRSRRYVAMHRYRLLVVASAALVAAVSFLPLALLAGSEGEATEATQEATEEEFTMPKIVDMVQPKYPEVARKAGAEGKVLLDVLVMADGSVGKVIIKEGVPEFPSLAESAVEAVRQWRFEAGTKDGEPADVQVIIPIQFRLDDKADKSAKAAKSEESSESAESESSETTSESEETAESQ
jgi:TonB family protein